MVNPGGQHHKFEQANQSTYRFVQLRCPRFELLFLGEF